MLKTTYMKGHNLVRRGHGVTGPRSGGRVMRTDRLRRERVRPPVRLVITFGTGRDHPDGAPASRRGADGPQPLSLPDLGNKPPVDQLLAHSGANSRSGVLVTCVVPLPFGFVVNRSTAPVDRKWLNSIFVPSGEKHGLKLPFLAPSPLNVSRVRPLPSGFMIAISEPPPK